MPISSRTRRRNSLSHNVATATAAITVNHIMVTSTTATTPRSSSVPSPLSSSCWRGGWGFTGIIATILITSYLVFLQPSSLFNDFDYQKELLSAFAIPNEAPKHLHPPPSFQVKKNETISSNLHIKVVTPSPIRIIVPPSNNTLLVRTADVVPIANTTPISKSLATKVPNISKQSIQASGHQPIRYYHTATTVDQVTILYSTTTAAPDSSSSSSLLSLLASSSRSHAIVYLVQKTHSTYQRDSFGLLLQSLDLLFQHYFDHHPNATSTDTTSSGEDPLLVWNKLNTTDIYLFHTGDFTQEDLQYLEDRYAPYYNHHLGPHHNYSGGYRPYASMFRLADLSRSKYWQVPKSLRRENISSWFRYPQFSVGYRHMCSWFAIGIWDFFQKLNQVSTVAAVAVAVAQQQNGQQALPPTGFNYTYIWRLDEDSFLLSPIRYDIFEFMQRHNYIYGYRLCSYELDYNYYMKGWFDKWHAKTRPRRTIVLENAGMCAFYNNFFVAQLAWFRQEPVQQFLRHMRPKIYRMRYGDLLLHTMALYAFGNYNENDNHDTAITSSFNNTNNNKHEGIHRFLDFTYQHITYNTTTQCVLYGGIQAGYNDPQATATMHEFYQHQHPLQQKQPCSEPLQRFLLATQDLSPTYQHLPSSLLSRNKTNMTLETIVVGRMEIPGKGVLSG